MVLPDVRFTVVKSYPDPVGGMNVLPTLSKVARVLLLLIRMNEKELNEDPVLFTMVSSGMTNCEATVPVEPEIGLKVI